MHIRGHDASSSLAEDLGHYRVTETNHYTSVSTKHTHEVMVPPSVLQRLLQRTCTTSDRDERGDEGFYNALTRP